MKKNTFAVIVIASVMTITTALPAHAYLDPGTASIVVQSIVAAVAASGATAALYWNRIKHFFGKLKASDAEKGQSKR